MRQVRLRKVCVTNFGKGGRLASQGFKKGKFCIEAPPRHIEASPLSPDRAHVWSN